MSVTLNLPDDALARLEAEAERRGVSLDELHKNLKEVLELCLEEAKEAGEIADFPHFFGLQQIEVAV